MWLVPNFVPFFPLVRGIITQPLIVLPIFKSSPTLHDSPLLLTNQRPVYRGNLGVFSFPQAAGLWEPIGVTALVTLT